MMTTVFSVSGSLALAPRRRFPVLTCLLAIVLSVLVPVGDAFGQGRVRVERARLAEHPPDVRDRGPYTLNRRREIVGSP